MLRVPKFKHPERVIWGLPPSKSHMIRWIALAAQSKSKVELCFNGIPGEDINSMANCMEKLGVEIQREPGKWTIGGKLKGHGSPKKTLECGNSATTARIVTSVAARFGGAIEIDGDGSLRRRDASALNSALRSLGCKIPSDEMPFSVSGPIVGGNAIIDQSISSQTLTGLLLASPSFPAGTCVSLEGEAVSRGYLELTIEICRSCGWGGDISGDSVDLGPWEVQTPEIVNIPEEISLLPLSKLFDALHGTTSMDAQIGNKDPRIMKAIGRTMICEGGVVNLRDASDIIAPAASLIAIRGGGSISGCSHARGKESDRIGSTIRMLSSFGILSEETEDGLLIPGGQWPSTPSEPVDSEGDHRLSMTAVVLASAVGGEVSGHNVCSSTHPEFIAMMMGEMEGL